MKFIRSGKYSNILRKYNNGLPDEVDCPSCDHPVYFQHSFLEIQSIFKNDKPAAINKIQFDYAEYFSRANHIITIGYSFPKDDIMNSVFIKNMKMRKDNIGKDCKLTFIGYNKHYLERNWLGVGDICKDELKSVIEVASSIFDINNIRFNFMGFPDIMNKIALSEILKWKAP